MNKKKTVITVAVLALVLVVGGLLAYFTDVTDTVTNTFTIGNVDISLSEPNWVAANAQNILPNKTLAKDPTVTNDSTTNPAYVFVKVEIPAIDASTPLYTYTTNDSWAQVGSDEYASNKITRVYVYGTAANAAPTSLAAGASTTTAVFSEVTLGNFTSTQLSSFATNTIDVTAYGIQTTDLGEATTATAIYALF